MDIQLTVQQAKRYLLSYQYLLPPKKLQGKQGVLSYIEKVGCIQFDPIDIVGKNSELVIQARVKDYQQKELEELLYVDKLLIDGWDKNMSIYGIKDWPYLHLFRDEHKGYLEEREERFKEVAQELKGIVAEKALSSKDLDHNEVVDWYWAPTKLSRAVLDHLFYAGEVLIDYRVGTRKYYKGTHKILPEEILYQQSPYETLDDYHCWHLERRIKSIGLLWNRPSDAFLGIRQFKANNRKVAFETLIKKAHILPICIEGIDETFYIPATEASNVLAIIDSDYTLKKEVTFLGPLDDMLWDRKLIKALFEFDYTWEIYKPAIERVYGHYVLPILYGIDFVGRIELKPDKAEGVIKIVNVWYEKNFNVTPNFEKALNKAIMELSRFNGF